MPTAALEEVYAAMDACRSLGMLPSRVSEGLGPHRMAFIELSQHPERLNEHDIRRLARSLRNAAAIFRLEQDCQRGRYAGALGGD